MATSLKVLRNSLSKSAVLSHRPFEVIMPRCDFPQKIGRIELDFSDLLYFEFTKLLKRGLQVGKYKLCGQYIVLQSRHETLFCDQIYIEKRTANKCPPISLYVEKGNY